MKKRRTLKTSYETSYETSCKTNYETSYKTSHTKIYAGLLFAALSLGAVACKNSGNASGSASASSDKVAKIIFVGKKNACACTKKRVRASWRALEAALDKKKDLPVQRLNIDTEASKVAPYKKQRAMVALPAIYFVDAKGKVVNMLQGKVSEKKLRAAINR